MHCSFLFCSLSFVAYPRNNISRFPENFLFLRPQGEQNNPRMPNVHAQIFNFSSVHEYTPTSVLAMSVPFFLSCHLSSWLCWLRDLLLAISCRGAAMLRFAWNFTFSCSSCQKIHSRLRLESEAHHSLSGILSLLSCCCC